MKMVNTKKLNTVGCFPWKFLYLFYCSPIFPREMTLVYSDANKRIVTPIYRAFAMWQIVCRHFLFNPVATIISKEWVRMLYSAFYRWGQQSPGKSNSKITANEWGHVPGFLTLIHPTRCSTCCWPSQGQEQLTRHSLPARQPLFEFLPPVRRIQLYSVSLKCSASLLKSNTKPGEVETYCTRIVKTVPL